MAPLPAPDEDLIRRLPLPLAQLSRRALNAKTPLERHLTAYYLWECGLKLLGSAVVVDYAEFGDHDPELADRLTNLARPAVGHWWEFARPEGRGWSSGTSWRGRRPVCSTRPSCPATRPARSRTRRPSTCGTRPARRPPGSGPCTHSFSSTRTRPECWSSTPAAGRPGPSTCATPPGR